MGTRGLHALDDKVSSRLLGLVHDDNRTPGRPLWMAALAVLVLSFAGAGCLRKSGAAVVLGKEYVPANEISASPNESASPHSSATPITRPEQWLVHVEMVADLKKMDVQVERPRWEALHEGDRVRVTYRQGKYTGTVWSAEID